MRFILFEKSQKCHLSNKIFSIFLPLFPKKTKNMESYFPNNPHIKSFESNFLRSIFKIFLKFSGNFIKMCKKHLGNLFKNRENFPKISAIFSSTKIYQKNHQKPLFPFRFFFFFNFIKSPWNCFKIFSSKFQKPPWKCCKISTNCSTIII